MRESEIQLKKLPKRAQMNTFLEDLRFTIYDLRFEGEDEDEKEGGDEGEMRFPKKSASICVHLRFTKSRLIFDASSAEPGSESPAKIPRSIQWS